MSAVSPAPASLAPAFPASAAAALLATLAATLCLGCDGPGTSRGPALAGTTARSRAGGGASPDQRAAPPAPSPAATPSPSSASRGCVAPMPATAAPTARAARICPMPEGPAPDMPHGRVRFVAARDTPSVEVEIARTDEHRTRGLMYRTELRAESGMLFAWPQEAVRTFWMHNTCLPLDMLFIRADGVIVGILEQVPTLNDAPRSVGCPASQVLELNAGWVRAHGVEPGQRVEVER